MSKLHTNNHGEVDSIFDAVNYSYFLKGAIVSREFARSVSSKYLLFFSFFFYSIKLLLCFIPELSKKRMNEYRTKFQGFRFVSGRMCGITINNV